MPSKPCLWLHGPPAPKAVTVVRMMSGFTRRRLSRSSDRLRSTSGGRLATTTSAVATSFRTISRPLGDDGSRVIARLLRFMTRYIAPTPSSPTGATQQMQLLDAGVTMGRIVGAGREPYEHADEVFLGVSRQQHAGDARRRLQPFWLRPPCRCRRQRGLTRLASDPLGQALPQRRRGTE